jgi:glutamate 5-kinase
MMKCIVVKIGSNIVASLDSDSGLNEDRIHAIAESISEIINRGLQVVIVSSGAIAAGRKKLGIKNKITDIKLKQATAAVGQTCLMNAYDKSFQCFEKKVAQILLTRDVVSDRLRYINARNTILTLLDINAIPIINENDSIAIDEIKFGDNDNLAALVAGLIDADMLIILSDVDGLYTKNPQKHSDAKLLKNVSKVTPSIEALADSDGNHLGTGGMYSKALAAKKATRYGIPVVIMSGKNPSLLINLIDGESVGTYFKPSSKRLSLKKRWIAHGLKVKGALVLDQGAVEAVIKQNKSLLPSGIIEVIGQFNVADSIDCLTVDKKKIARGLTNYSSEDLNKIKGVKSLKIAEILGFKYSDEAIHRDNLVIW